MADYQSKLDRLISSVQKNVGLSNIVPGTKSYQLLQSVAYEQLQVENVLEQDTIDNSLLNSSGDKLVNIGDGFFGIEKRMSISTEVSDVMESLQFYVKNGTFGDINSGNDIVIPSGTILEGTMPDGSLVRLATTNQQRLLKNSLSIFISAKLIQGPTDIIPLNTITNHHFTNYTQSGLSTLLVTNSRLVSTGRPDESDDNYRFRVINGLRSFAKTNTAGIFDAATDVPGVSYVQIDPSHNGGGTFAVYVQSIDPITPDSTIQAVTDAVSSSIGPWVNYQVLKPNYVGLQLDITVTTKNPSQYVGDTGFITSIQNAISFYVNNFLDPIFYLLDILRLIENTSQDVVTAKFNSVNQYFGMDKFRYPISIPVDSGDSQVITLGNFEKLIIESIVNPIIIRVV
jgi:hypothetical protein